ncbi:MAG: hypothetical protein MUO67_10050 [Anaerolineales bacterium]|nr:hypothetical protein [Anaerolineales bacterium]
MNDVLPSASLILAVIALLFTAWKDEIQEARDLSIRLHYVDSEKDHNKVKEALWRRSFPLTFSATIMIILFLPEIVCIINQSVEIICTMGFTESLSNYDVKSATFIFVFFIFIAFAFYLWSLTLALYKRHRKFEERRILDLQKETE